VPSPYIEYGVAYGRDNPSPALANLIAIVEEIAPPLSGDSELLWGRQVVSRA
jgi:hypothetical protein